MPANIRRHTLCYGALRGLFYIFASFFSLAIINPAAKADLVGTYAGYPVYGGGEGLTEATNACGVQYNRLLETGNTLGLWTRCWNGGIGDFLIPGINKIAPALRIGYSPNYTYYVYLISTNSLPPSEIPGLEPLDHNKDLG